MDEHQFDILKEAAYQEARLLSQHATNKEKDKLKITYINPRSSIGCIYGLMTGNCYSERATQLIKLCAQQPFYETLGMEPFDRINIKMELVRGYSVFTSFTSIEVYLNMISKRKDELTNLINTIKYAE